jgi:hypothetical protein
METFQSFSLVFGSLTRRLIFDFIEFDTWVLLTPISFLLLEHRAREKD